MMNNNSRGKKSRRESAREKEAFTYRGEKNRISREKRVTLQSLEGNEGSYEGDLSGEGREKATACENSASKRGRLQKNCAARR